MAARDRDSTFAEALERLMRARGVSQARLAADLGTYDANVARWRKGRGITLQNAQAIADYFGVDRGYMTALAGYPDNSVTSTEDTIDKGMAAMLDAEREQIRRELRDIPEVFHEAIMTASRSTRRAFIDSLRQAGISLPGDDGLAPPVEPTTEKPGPRSRRPRGRLSGPLSPVLAY